MTKRLPSTRYTSPPHNPQPLYEEEGEEISPTSFVPAYRKVVAGNGLKGGGDLSRDRKFDIDFGNEENTAVEGNDPRLFDARDWDAPRATEVELTQGTEEEPRKLSPKDLRDAVDAWWENSEHTEGLKDINPQATQNKPDAYLLSRNNHTGTQSIDTIENLRQRLDSLGSGGGYSSSLFAIVKTIDLIDSDEYLLTSADIGRTLIFNTVSDTLNIKMNACFGSLSDEIYLVAPRAFFHDSSNPINFYTEMDFTNTGGGITQIPPVVATGLLPSFREGRSIACLKKCFTGGIGMDDWLLFGDIAAEEYLP